MKRIPLKDIINTSFHYRFKLLEFRDDISDFERFLISVDSFKLDEEIVVEKRVVQKINPIFEEIVFMLGKERVNEDLIRELTQ